MTLQNEALPVGEMIVNSKLLVLQSKQLLLMSAQARFKVSGQDRHSGRISQLESQVIDARERFGNAVLKWSEPSTPQYRLVAFGALVTTAERLRVSLRGAVAAMPGSDRAEIATDVTSLELIIAGWRDMIRGSIEAVA